MKQINIFKSFLIVACALSALTTAVAGQGIFGRIKDEVKKTGDTAKEKASKVKDDAKNNTVDTTGAGNNINFGDPKYLHWARLDVQASWKEYGQTKYERRTYYSDIINITERVPDERENVSAYFNEGIVEQLKTRGIEIQYYTETVEVFPKSEPYSSRGDAEEIRNKMIENDREGKRAVYTFNWKFNAKNVSEEITQPKRIYSVNPAPALETKDAPVNTAERTAKTQEAQNTKAEAEIAQREKKIWGFVAMTVQVRKENKQFSRVYISEIAELSDAVFKKYYNTDPTNYKPRIREYFVATVIAAAKERGEEVSEPDDYSLVGMDCKFSVESYIKEDSYTTGYRYNPQSVLEAPRRQQIDYAKSSSRPVFFFRWDPSGKNVQADLAKERNRGNSANLPD